MMAISHLTKSMELVASFGNFTRAEHPRAGNAPQAAVSEAMWRVWAYSRDQPKDDLHEHSMWSYLVGRLIDYAFMGRPT